MSKSVSDKAWPIRVLGKWIWLVGLLPLLLDLLAAYVPLEQLPREVRDLLEQGLRWEISVVLLSGGLLGSAYLVHRDTQRELASLYSQQAKLILRLSAFSLLHEEPILHFTRRYQNGLMPDGLPIKAIVAATIEVHNIGREEGQLEWELDLERSDLPDIFHLFEGEENGKMYDLPLRIPPRKRIPAMWRLECGISPVEPSEFAHSLREKPSFSLLLKYRTIRLVAPSEYSEVTVSGGIDAYRRTISKRWEMQGNTDLVSILKPEKAA